jgi:murein DD-endopeptidase MepM/ murein hydrolase activator NlpD
MSSLHQDRLLIEGSEPVTGTASTLPTARGTRRRAVGSSEERATSKVPTPRPGTAQRPGTTQTTGDRTAPASRAKRATAAKAAAAATGTLASRAKAATVKVATAKAATAKAATAKAATAAVRTVSPAKSTRQHAAGAKRTVAPEVAAVPVEAPAAKPAAAKATPAAKAATAAKPTKAPAAKAPAAKAPAAKAVAIEAAVPAAKSVRPTPYKRATALADVPVMAPVADAAELLRDDAADVVVVRKDVAVEPAVEAAIEVAQESTVARLPRFLRRRPPVVRHRPSLYLVAAVVGALGLGTITAGGPDAQATANMSHSVSVAEELGIGGGPTEAITPADATQRLGELAVSRNVRADEQAAAAQVQAEADRVAAEIAAEAARPKAVIPVQGARLTSTFGARWGTLHAGIDLAAPIGTPEYAAMDGVVLEAGPASGYGNAVYIQHENGDVTVYGHMEKILVTAGQVVKAGDTIALLGNRGQSTGPHLHFEVHVGGMDGQKVDPLPWLRERGVGI